MKETEQKEQSNQDKITSGKQFLPLNDLVYAPIDAIASSNARLSLAILDEIKSMGAVKIRNGEETLYLKKLNLAYERLHPTEHNEPYMESVQIEVPLLSIIKIPNLKIKNATLEFSTEVHISENEQNAPLTVGKISSLNREKSTAQPVVNYKIDLKAVDETEGYMRILDILNANPVAKQIDASPISSDGIVQNSEKDDFLFQRSLRQQEAALHKLHQEITEYMETRESLQEELEPECLSKEFSNAPYDPKEYEELRQTILTELISVKEAMLENKVESFKKGGAPNES